MRIKLFSCILIINFAIAQEKPIILWDLHGVLFHQKSFIPLLLQYPYLSQLISHISWTFLKDLVKAGITSIEYLPITQKYNNPYLQDFLIKVANDISPITPVHDVVHELAALGYDQRIGSNISPIAFTHLINPQLYPDHAPFFSLFNIPASQTGHVRNGTTIRKPNPQYYLDYVTKNNIDLTKQPIIFIDDKRDNVIEARKLGFDAIQFKNPSQLRHELRMRGIAIAPPTHTFSDQKKSYILSKSLF